MFFRGIKCLHDQLLSLDGMIYLLPQGDYQDVCSGFLETLTLIQTTMVQSYPFSI